MSWVRILHAARLFAGSFERNQQEHKPNGEAGSIILIQLVRIQHVSIYTVLAQSVEHLSYKQGVVGAEPTRSNGLLVQR